MPRVVTPECANQKARSRRLKPTLYSKKSKVKLHAVCSTAAWMVGGRGWRARVVLVSSTVLIVYQVDRSS
jgi:hypothetical protein